MNSLAMHTDLFHYRALSDGEMESFRENGYLSYGLILTLTGLERMRAECMNAWEAEKDAYDEDNSWLQNSLLGNIHHKSQVVRDFYFEGPLVDVAEQVIGPNIKSASSQLTFKMRGNTKAFGWHQDNGYGQLDPYNAISCLTALDDTDEDNGCLRLIPGSNRQGQIAVEGRDTLEANKKRESIELDVDDSGGVPMPMKAGDCLFFTCWTLHKSDGNRSKTRDRRILFARYADADAVEVDNDRKPRLGRLVRGSTRFPEVEAFEADL